MKGYNPKRVVTSGEGHNFSVFRKTEEEFILHFKIIFKFSFKLTIHHFINYTNV